MDGEGGDDGNGDEGVKDEEDFGERGGGRRSSVAERGENEVRT